MSDTDDIEPLDAWGKDYLKPRAIPLRWAVQLGMGTQPVPSNQSFNGEDKDARERARRRKNALAIPYFNADGTLNGFKRWRLTDKQATAAGRKFDQERGSGTHVYMPPLRDGRTLQDVFDDPNEALYIVEGETRAAAMSYHNMPALGIGGIDMWSSEGELCTDLARIPMDGREIVYVFDADVPLKRTKQDRVLRLARELDERGANVHLLPVRDLGDGKTGADDFIASEGIREFRKLIKQAKPWTHPDFAEWGEDGISLNLDLSPVGREWLLNEPPPLEWTWEGYLPRGSVALLIAQGGAGKSFFVQRLTQAVAGGCDFLGRSVRQGKAVHLSAEEGSDELRRRVHRTYGYETEHMEASKSKAKQFASALQRNLYVRSVVGQQLFIVTMDRFNVVQGKAVDILIHQLKALGGVELLVLDPLSRIHSIPEESQSWGTSIINACERIAQEVGCTVLVLHHTGKGDRKDLYAARGASALADAARVVLLLKAADPNDCKGVSNVSDHEIATERVMRLLNPKLSYGPRQVETWLRRTDGGVLDRFVPEYRRTDADPDNLLAMQGWIAKTGKPLFKETVKKRFREIFDGRLTRDEALEAFARAVNDGRLKPASGSKNPRSRGYVVAQEDES